jgi:sensor histidine kinase YesM
MTGVASGRQSIGLRNVDERLRMLYGEAYGLHIESAPGNGTRVVIRIPLRNGALRAAHADSPPHAPE